MLSQGVVDHSSSLLKELPHRTPLTYQICLNPCHYADCNFFTANGTDRIVVFEVVDDMAKQIQRQDEILGSIIRELKEQFPLSRLFLFGSRGRGEADRDSDFDLVVVVRDSTESRFKREVRARVALKDVPAAIDIFVYTESEFDEARKEFGSIAETATVEGQEIPLAGI